jgi:CubicO group peptidase (beta-lactamase class C family)
VRKSPVDSVAPTGLGSKATPVHGLRPWLHSVAAPRLYEEKPILQKVLIITLLIVAAVTIGFLAAPHSRPLPTESISDKVDKQFAPWNRPDSPGCSVAVGRNGVVLYEHGYGMANLELGVPITPVSRFHVASISKPMTAMSVLLLAERGRLSLDDEVRKYVPEFPDFGQRLTIRHLLSHTSGLRDAYLLREFAAPYDEATDRVGTIVRLLARQKGLNFAPGAEFQYNNGGYTLLSEIVKRVSGESLAAFTTSNIFKPLGMPNTRFHDNPAMLEPNRATGYHRDGSSWNIPVHSDFGRIVGNSGLITTARDLLHWEQNFAEPRVGSAAALVSMQTPAILTGGATSPYGLGLFIGNYHGLRAVSHSGGDPGYAANLVRYPDRGLAVAILCNFDDPPLDSLTNAVSDIFLGDPPEKPQEPAAAENLSHVQLLPDQLAARAGLYHDAVRDTFGRVFVREGKLMTEAAGATFELMPVSSTRFVLSGTSVAIDFTPQEMRVSGAGPNVTVLQKMDPPSLSRSELIAFAGQYTNSEVDATYTLAVVGSSLALQRRGRPTMALEPVYSDTFHAELFDLLKFSRDPRGIVTGFTIKTDGVRSLRFDRLMN